MDLGRQLQTSYAELGEEELLRMAKEYDSLTDEGQAALRSEFARRGMETPVIEDRTEESRTLVTVRRYRDLSEAIVARSLLESAGVEVFLYDENLVRLDWQISNFIGGIRLQVTQADADTVRELLDQPVPETIEFAGPFDASGPEFQQPQCPQCGSREISFEGAGRGVALTSLYVLGIPMPGGRETWVCSHCGNRWDDTPDAH